MSANQNRIYVPAKYNVKVSILMDSRTGASELKIEQGNPIPIQVLGLLMEHATHILRMTYKGQPAFGNNGNGLSNESTEGDKPNVS